MRISKDQPERKTLVIPRPEAQPERLEPSPPANEPERKEQPAAQPEPQRKVA